jgi:hypothetical protein
MQVMDLDSLALSVQCPIATATQQELNAGKLASEGPPRAPNSDGTGLSSRPGSPFKVWLDFNGSVITGTCERQEHLQHQHNIPC